MNKELTKTLEELESELGNLIIKTDDIKLKHAFIEYRNELYVTLDQIHDKLSLLLM